MASLPISKVKIAAPSNPVLDIDAPSENTEAWVKWLLKSFCPKIKAKINRVKVTPA